MGNYKITYNVDMVFCIDSTGSMDGILNTVKTNALNFYNDVINTMAEKHKIINQLRIRVISFRDYIADGENAMKATDFFVLPDDTEKFKQCINSIEATGGGDDPEDGLEALAYAIRSKWDTEGTKKRQVIVVWTDAGTHELGFGSTAPNYPKSMPKDFAELSNWWGDKQGVGQIDQNAKRLLLFSPDEEGWKTISDSWDNVIHYQSVAGNGLEEIDYKQIIDAISSTI